LFGLFVPSAAAVRKSEQFLNGTSVHYGLFDAVQCARINNCLFFDDNIFIVLILSAYKWLPPFAADV